MEVIEKKQQELIEKIKAKRALSGVPDKSENVRGASINPLAKTVAIPKIVDNSLQEIKLSQIKAEDENSKLHSPRF